MVGDVQRLVKLRVNASGTRLIGHVALLQHENRISDRLNDPEALLLLDTVESGDYGAQCVAISKDAVSYVVALEEPDLLHNVRRSGAFQWVTVELIQPNSRLTGELFVPNGFKVTDCLNDDRRFVNLKNVAFDESAERYEFLALGKRQCRLWAVLGADRAA